MFKVQVAEHVSRDAVGIAKRSAYFDSNGNLFSSEGAIPNDDRMHSSFIYSVKPPQNTRKMRIEHDNGKQLAGGVEETFGILKKEHNELVVDILLEFYDSARLVAASGDIFSTTFKDIATPGVMEKKKHFCLISWENNDRMKTYARYCASLILCACRVQGKRVYVPHSEHEG